MTRAYALEKLGESGEREALARRHAEYYRNVFERAEVEWETRPTPEWLADYGLRIDNLRATLDWALLPEGDAAIGVELTAAAAPLWMQLSLLGECRSRAEQAIAAVERGAGRDARREMKLHTVLSQALRYTGGSALVRSLRVHKSLSKLPRTSVISIINYDRFGVCGPLVLRRAAARPRAKSCNRDLACWGRFYQGLLVLKRGHLETGLRMLRSGFEEIGDRADLGYSLLLGTFAEALGYAGQIAEGLVAIEQGIDRAEHNEEGWIIAELLRLKGELLLLQDAPGAAAKAEDHFRRALDWARRQGALSWELRAATSLARRCHDQARSKEARALLGPVYDRFTEGFTTTDLKAVRALLDELS